MRGVLYDSETRNQVIEMAESGASVASVAEHFGVAKSTVSEWKASGKRSGDQRVKHSPEQVAERRARVFALYARGVQGAEIAGELKMARSQVYRWIQDAKLQGTLSEQCAAATAPKSKPKAKPGRKPGKPTLTVTGGHLEAVAPADERIETVAGVPAVPAHTVGELLVAARARLGIASSAAGITLTPSSGPAPDYRHGLELARLRGAIEALTIERDALRTVIDRMHARGEHPEG